MAARFNVLLMDTIEDTHLLELQEEAMDLTFYGIFLF